MSEFAVGDRVRTKLWNSNIGTITHVMRCEGKVVGYVARINETRMVNLEPSMVGELCPDPVLVAAKALLAFMDKEGRTEDEICLRDWSAFPEPGLGNLIDALEEAIEKGGYHDA